MKLTSKNFIRNFVNWFVQLRFEFNGEHANKTTGGKIKLTNEAEVFLLIY